MAADELGRGAAGVARPGITERKCRARGAAVGVVETTSLEVGPLRDRPGALDAGRVGAEEVGLAERRGVCDAGEDDKPQEDKGAGEQKQRRKG